jgi:hypothetical protein
MPAWILIFCATLALCAQLTAATPSNALVAVAGTNGPFPAYEQGVAVADFNGDGKLDVALIHSGTGLVAVPREK